MFSWTSPLSDGKILTVIYCDTKMITKRLIRTVKKNIDLHSFLK